MKEKPSTEYTIRRVGMAEETQWRSLWHGYLTFYESKLDDEITNQLWKRIHDSQHPISALVVAETNTGELNGLVHYFTHSSTWHTKSVCYLADLFVLPTARAGGLGQRLIDAVSMEAENSNCAELYWHTQAVNDRARGLYDKVTGGTDGFVCYRVKL